jgi:uncharacterized membrane protein YgdD (TMEM256/DUF423 family)
MRNLFLRIGSVAGFLAVALGAFAAHGLRPHLSDKAFDTFETAVRYQFYHALAILLVVAFSHFGRKRALRMAAWAFTLGIVLFSGSLYGLSTREIHHLPIGWLGPITPLGGLCFLLGWGALFYSSFSVYDRKPNNP